MSMLDRVVAVVLLGTSCIAQEATRSPGWVVIPVREYEALRGKAYPVERDAEPESIPATLTRVDYDLRIDGVVASGRASLTVDVLKDGWVRVPIPQGLLVRDARLGGESVSLVPTPGRSPQLSVVLSKKGRSVLMLDVAFTVGSAGGEERLSLPVGASGVTRAAIAFAPQDVEVKVTGGHLSEKSTAGWLAYARGGEPLTFAWRKQFVERRIELPPRVRGSLIQLYGLGEDSSSLNAEVELEVVQGSTSHIKIEVPEALTINQVPGANVADWDVKGGELVVNFLDPVERSTKFAITGEARLARDGTILVPLMRLVETEREAGGVAVEVLGAGEIKSAKAQGLEEADAAELGTMVVNRQSPSLAAFRYRAGAARSLNVNVARYAQQAVLTANIEEARYRVLMTIDGKTLIQARYSVRNNQRNFVSVTLPAGASVWSSALAGRPVRPGQGPDGNLLFPLAKGRAGDEAPPFAIEILYSVRSTAWNSKGRATLALPVLDLPVSRTGVVLYYPPLFRVSAEPGAFRAQPYEGPASEILIGGAATSAPAPVEGQETSPAQSATQALVDRYRARTDARKTAEALPIRVSFPSVGPSLFLVSELTGESKGAVVDLSYQKDGKGGVR
jgi:hypothetical protein